MHHNAHKLHVTSNSCTSVVDARPFQVSTELYILTKSMPKNIISYNISKIRNYSYVHYRLCMYVYMYALAIYVASIYT